MRHSFIPYAIAFRAPVATGAGTWAERRGAWLRVEDEHGRVGWGEIAPLDVPGTPESVAAAMAAGPCRDAALSLAQLDLEAQRIARPLAFLLADSPRKRVEVNALLFAQDATSLAGEAASAVAAGHRVLKLKVGAGKPEEDIARVQAVCERVGAGVTLRLDANGAWDVATALAVLRALEDCGIEFVEDPVAGDAGELRRQVDVPVACDLRSLEEGWRIVRARGADVLVVKPTVLGPLRAVRELAVAAIESGLGVVVSSSFDTAIGVAGALHLAASLPGSPRAHGLATVGLLEDAPVEGLAPPHGGEMALPAGPGLGVRLRDRTP